MNSDSARQTCLLWKLYTCGIAGMFIVITLLVVIGVLVFHP